MGTGKPDPVFDSAVTATLKYREISGMMREQGKKENKYDYRVNAVFELESAMFVFLFRRHAYPDLVYEFSPGPIPKGYRV